jgi:exonuclease SbcC
VKLQESLLRREEMITAEKETQKELDQARQLEEEAVRMLADEEERSAERERAAARVRELESLDDKLGLLRAAEQERIAAVAQVTEAERVLEEAKRGRESTRAAVTELLERLDVAQRASAEVEPAKARLEHAVEDLERRRRLEEARRDAAEGGRALEEALAGETTALDDYRAAEAAMQEMESRWKAGRAAALAGTLVPGQPCPVCGSRDHPAPATEGEESVADGDLDVLKAKVSTAREGFDHAREKSAGSRAAHTAAQARESSIRRELGLTPEDEGPSLEAAEAEVGSRRDEVEALKQQSDVGELKTEVTEAEQVAEEAAKAAEVADSSLAKSRTERARAQARLDERAAAVPEALRPEGALEAALEEARESSNAQEEAYRKAEGRAHGAKERRVVLQTEAEGAAKASKSASKQELEARKGFLGALSRYGFTDEGAWREQSLGDDERVSLEQELESHRDLLQQAKGRLEQAETAAEGQPEPTDLDRLQAVAEEAELQHTQAIQRHSEARARLQSLAGIAEKLTEIDGQADGVRQAYTVAGVLAEVAEGKNPGRVSFQRWVLGVYLDEVLASASRRFYAMSKGRYRLERQREAAGRGRPSGLDLAVFDEFSGALRSAVTLSGGESFLAALSLALGLADTVQEHSAGIPLETIFVDEGFGALDADALELAVDALMELQSGGRLVGVISHVPELKQVIPARLEVSGGSGGSSTRFVVP